VGKKAAARSSKLQFAVKDGEKKIIRGKRQPQELSGVSTDGLQEVWRVRRNGKEKKKKD